MNSPPSSLTPSQDRSRATLERLLNATIGVLDEFGLEGAHIPRIAKAAGMAPANVYRRFVDKEALLRAAFLHALARSNASNRDALAAQLLAPTLEGSARKLAQLFVSQYQRHPHFLRALSRFIDADTDAEFVRQVREKIGVNVTLIIALLLSHAGEIAHLPADAALRFAVLNMACSVEVFMLEPHSLWHLAPAISSDALMDNLVRGFVNYLTLA